MVLPNNDIGEKTREVLAAQAHIWNHTFNFINSMSLKCAIQFGIPDIIHSHGRPMTLSNLVDALPINNNNAKIQDCVYGLMRILIHAGFFIQENEARIPFLQLQLDPIMMNPWHYLSKWFQNEDSTPFLTAHGKPLYEYAEKEPKFSCLFNEDMATDAQFVASVMTEHCKGVFEGLKSLVDVGGGNGALTKAITDAFPQINFTVFDLPHIIEGLEGCRNLRYVGGDMFKSIPSADAILLKWILHNWNDEECIKILKRCKEAIPNKENGVRLIIIDMVMDHNLDHKSYETQLFKDMLMSYDDCRFRKAKK
ncbi:hypothetical protein P3S68_007101 [Capsicum galapagoense]